VKQSILQKELLGKATEKYVASIYQAESYLKNRGIPIEVARLAQLGVVEEPEVGHEAYTGRLSIPYITKTGVVDLRFRSLNPAVEPKYMGLTGAETRMYNVLDIEKADNFIGVCEGELDTITMSSCIGIPCVGVPGANSWKKHYTRLLADFERVFVFADGDLEQSSPVVLLVNFQLPSFNYLMDTMLTLCLSKKALDISIIR
jgi:DNA primase